MKVPGGQGALFIVFTDEFQTLRYAGIYNYT